jgi:hypothetical protein
MPLWVGQELATHVGVQHRRKWWGKLAAHTWLMGALGLRLQVTLSPGSRGWPSPFSSMLQQLSPTAQGIQQAYVTVTLLGSYPMPVQWNVWNPRGGTRQGFLTPRAVQTQTIAHFSRWLLATTGGSLGDDVRSFSKARLWYRSQVIFLNGPVRVVKLSKSWDCQHPHW